MIEADCGPSNQLGIDARLASDLLNLGKRQRTTGILLSLFGLLQLGRALDDERDFFFAVAAAVITDSRSPRVQAS